MGEWTIIPSLKADGHAVLVHKRLSVASFGPTPHEVACANFAQNKRAEFIAATMNAMQGIPDPAKFVDVAKRLRNGFKIAIGLLEMDANKNELITEFDQALAAKPTDPPKESQ